jgi:predicted PurR-regulated permease PerM
MEALRAVWLRHWRLIAFVCSLVIGLVLLYALWSALVPFLLGLVLAYLLLPVVRWGEKRLPATCRYVRARRIITVLLLLIAVFGLIGLAAYYVLSTVISSFTLLLYHAPAFLVQGLLTLQDLAEAVVRHFPPEVHGWINELLQDLGATVGKGIRDAFLTGVASIPSRLSFLLGFATLPIFLFYVLKDSEQLTSGFYSRLSPWAAGHARNVVSIVEGVLGRYIRAQLMLGLVVAVLSFIGLSILDISFAPALAIFAGVTELIPILGPWIGGAFAVVVTLATTPEKAIWVVVVFVSVQFVENNLLVPRIQGGYLRIHPAVVLVLLVVGSFVAGIWGIILIVPLTATVVEIYRYLRRNVYVAQASESVHSSSE